MAWHSSIPTRSSGYGVTATNWNDLVDNLNYLAEVNYTEFTADVSITATTVGTANQIVSSGAITYTADPILIEFSCGRFNAPANATQLILRDGTTVLGTLAQIAASATVHPLYTARRLTPTAASHTYNVAAWVTTSGTGTVKAGTGGTAGDATTYLPGWIRITRVPT